MVLLSLDPSIVSPGVALFRDGILFANARLRVKSESHSCAIQRCDAAAGVVLYWLDVQEIKPDCFVFEWPQVYPGPKGRTPPNDLFALAGVGAMLAGYMQCEAHSYLPREWAGQTRKSKTGSALESMRGKRVLARLSPEEKKVLVDQHDAVDAVGIGLHHLGRFERTRVFSGATL